MYRCFQVFIWLPTQHKLPFCSRIVAFCHSSFTLSHLNYILLYQALLCRCKRRALFGGMPSVRKLRHCHLHAPRLIICLCDALMRSGSQCIVNQALCQISWNYSLFKSTICCCNTLPFSIIHVFLEAGLFSHMQTLCPLCLWSSFMILLSQGNEDVGGCQNTPMRLSDSKTTVEGQSFVAEDVVCSAREQIM